MGVSEIKNIIVTLCEELLRRKAKAPKTVNIRINTGVVDSVFDGYNVIDRGTNVQHSHIGYATVIGPNCKIAYADIGKYCSIAPNVKMVLGTHPSEKFVSTCPVFYSTRPGRGFTFARETLFEEFKYIDELHKVSIRIGNDVWIGANALILQGVTIGDGAIIAAGAVITKDVEPYSIVGGVPAKEIRKRFTEHQINILKNVRWWDKNIKWLEENSSHFSDIEDFTEWIAMEDLDIEK